MNSLQQSPRTSGKTTMILEKLREQRVMEMLKTKPVQTDSIILPETEEKTEPVMDNKRRDIVNKIKESLVVKFQRQVAILHHRNSFESDYNDTDFCKDMTNLIDDFQGRLDKLKINGKFYATKPEKVELAVVEELDSDVEEIDSEICECECGNEYSLEDGENEECESCNYLGCNNCITHTTDDQYLCMNCC